MRALIFACFLLSACATVPPHIERNQLDTMVADIIGWVAANSDYPVVAPPRILFVDELPAYILAYIPGATHENTPAAYYPYTQTVYLPTSLRLDVEYYITLLAHELVHHFQFTSGLGSPDQFASGLGPQVREEFEKEAFILGYEASLYICRPDGVERGDGFSPGSC